MNMNGPMGPVRRGSTSASRIALAVTWSFVILLMVNALWFVLRASSPVIQADAWYYLDVFVRKAIDGRLQITDFFVKRSADDHALPLFKLILLFEWRYFDLDYVVEAVFGVLATIACALIFYAVLMRHWPRNTGNGVPLLAWIAICALLFSLGSVGVWVWPLVALENITILVILFFMLAVWHAHRSQHYLPLVVAILVLGISSDDSAIIAVIATLMSVLLALRADPEQRVFSAWRIIAIVIGFEVLVRIGYAHIPGAPVASAHASTPLVSVLVERFKQGGWWQWILLPLVLPVYYQSPLKTSQADVWFAVQAIMGVLLLAAHVFFWRRALRGRYNLPVFMAVCMMLLSYGWLAGIILWRVSASGNDYLEQPRYVMLYAEQLIALLLMWAGSQELGFEAVTTRRRPVIWWQTMRTWGPVVGALLLLLAQVPQSIHAWRMPKYEWAYYAKQAAEIDALARDPVHTKDCDLVNPVCGESPKIRRELTQLLSANRLNIYSPRMRRWHSYLPTPTQVPAEPVSSVDKAGSDGNDHAD
ncbi:MAG TPA: hypothetical protein VGU03_01870 [Frateuria sp.]|uniref:hypothetical protein n=1 Tax=Frateuria sp. TaxID=2211372 RepID=UPI002DE3FFB6|nr:hypothetical protein [Frateuria sp.]